MLARFRARGDVRRRAGSAHGAPGEARGGIAPAGFSRFGERALGRAASSGFRIGLLAGPYDPG